MKNIFDSYGQFIDYFLMPEHRQVQFVAIKTKIEFNAVLKAFHGRKIDINYKELILSDTSIYQFDTVRLSERVIYELSNGFFAIDQFSVTRANSYYVCASLQEFMLISKYLLVFPPLNLTFIVQCHISDHRNIKRFLEREKDQLDPVAELCNDTQKVFLSSIGQCVYIRYNGDQRAFRQTDLGRQLDKLWKPYRDKTVGKNEDIVYISLVICESLHHFKEYSGLHGPGS